MCPCLDRESGELTTGHTLQVGQHLTHLYKHLLENGYIRELDAVDKSKLSIYSHDVLEKIRRGEPDWKDMVPETVADIILEKRLFDCKG